MAGARTNEAIVLLFCLIVRSHEQEGRDSPTVVGQVDQRASQLSILGGATQGKTFRELAHLGRMGCPGSFRLGKASAYFGPGSASSDLRAEARRISTPKHPTPRSLVPNVSKTRRRARGGPRFVDYILSSLDFTRLSVI